MTTPIPAAMVKELRDSTGATVATGTAKTSGTSVSITLETQDVTPGTYQLKVQLGGPNAQASQFTGYTTVHYESGMAMDHSNH